MDVCTLCRYHGMHLVRAGVIADIAPDNQTAVVHGAGALKYGNGGKAYCRSIERNADCDQLTG